MRQIRDQQANVFRRRSLLLRAYQAWRTHTIRMAEGRQAAHQLAAQDRHLTMKRALGQWR